MDSLRHQAHLNTARQRKGRSRLYPIVENPLCYDSDDQMETRLTVDANRSRSSIRTSSDYGRKLLPISDNVFVAIQSVRECSILDP